MSTWTLLYFSLILEVAICLVLCIPTPLNCFRAGIIKVFNAFQSSGLLTNLFRVVALLQLIMFFDCMRTIDKIDHLKGTYETEHIMLLNQNRLLRNQRNAYISGFSLFLFVIIWKFHRMTLELYNYKKAEDAKKAQ